MAAISSKPIVVGVDGSDNAVNAVAYAAREAEIRSVPLRIVHPFAWPLLKLHADADVVLSAAERAATAAAPSVPVLTAVRSDFPLPLLIQESRDATFVVIGSPGLGALADAITASDREHLVARARAPVMVVPTTTPPEPTTELVVVGVDDSRHADAAVALAAEEAVLRRGRLLAAHVTHHTRRLLLSRFGTAPDLGGERILDRALARWRQAFPDLPIEERIMAGDPGGELVDLSRTAAVVAVGARGRGGFADMLLGSVSKALLHHAHSPVIIVPPELGE